MEEKKYIRLFQTHSEYEEFVNSDEYITPCVSLCKDTHKLHYNPYVEEVKPIVLNYFTLVNTSEEPLSVQLKQSSTAQTLNYKLSNSEDWVESSDVVTVDVGEEVQLKGNYTPTSSSGIGTFVVNGGTFDVKGNIMSLLYGNDFEGQIDLTSKDYAFRNLFKGCTTLVNANELILLATTLASQCYSSMFEGCTNLVDAPELPATTLASFCYHNMFASCSSLTTAPELPATTLASSCYYSMFYDCTSLVTAPELLATTLASKCYSYMFAGCTNLTTAPALPATTLASYCYQLMFFGCSNLSNITMLATDISASDCLTNWVNGVASEGTFTKYPQMTSLPNGSDGIPNGWTVVDYEDASSDLITFTIENGTYHAVQGMTWEEWVNSEYNTIGVTISKYNNYVMYTHYNVSTQQAFCLQYASDVIIGNESYIWYALGGDN